MADPGRQSVRPGAAEVALLAVALAAGLGSLRLVAHPGSTDGMVPVVTVVATGHLATDLAGRWRLPVVVRLAVGTVASALAAVWTVLPATTWWGLPGPASAAALWHRLSGAVELAGNHPTPLPPTTGVVLLMALVAGGVAVAGSALWGVQRSSDRWRRRAAVALLPSLGLFAYGALVSSERDRLAATVAYVATVLLFLLAAEVGTAAAGHPVRRRAGVAGIGTGVLAVAGVLAVGASPGVAGMSLRALVNGPGTATSSGPVRALDLVADIRAVEVGQSGDVVFTAATPVATYWQVATLTRFDGTRWRPAAVTPPSLPFPVAADRFTATVSLRSWQGHRLPQPPGTFAVLGPPGAREVLGVGAVGPAGTGYTYQVVAPVPNAAPAAGAPLAPVGAGQGVERRPSARQLAPYLALPPLPAAVKHLAHRVAAGAATPAAKASALVHWFTSGRYRYTLNPPSAPAEDALSWFLFRSRAGFCQQFAGAFAVLARLDGLPTRVAVGFAPGSSPRSGTYDVTGADAHVWPEVYLGPTEGWVSFEATPGGPGSFFTGAGSQEPAAPAGSDAVSGGAVPGVPPTAGSGVGTSPRSNSASSDAAGGLRAAAWPPLAAAGAAAAVAFGVVQARRRRRTRRRPEGRATASDGAAWDRTGATAGRAGSLGDPATSGVLGPWSAVADELDRAGWGRAQSETLVEHAARLRATAEGRDLGGPEAARALRNAIDAYAELAVLATRASYGPGPADPSDVTEAGRLAGSFHLWWRRAAPARSAMAAVTDYVPART